VAGRGRGQKGYGRKLIPMTLYLAKPQASPRQSRKPCQSQHCFTSQTTGNSQVKEVTAWQLRNRQ